MEGEVEKLPSAQLKLSILIGVDSFDYIISDTSNQIRAFRSYAFDAGDQLAAVKQSLDRDELLQRDYFSSRLTLLSSPCTLTPQNLFKPSAERAYLEQVVDLPDDHKVLHRQLPAAQVYAIFAMPSRLQELIQEKQPRLVFRHLTEVLGNYALDQPGPADQLYLHWSSNRMSAVLIKAGQLHFSNSFSVPNNNQLVYYLGLLINQFALEQREIPVFISGDILEEDPYFETILRYFPNLDFAALPEQIKGSPSLAKHPVQYWLLPALGLL